MASSHRRDSVALRSLGFTLGYLGRTIGLGVILALAGWLLLWKLGNQRLWQDEAQTALVSQTVMTGGIPLGHDGRNSFSQELGAEFGSDHVFKWHPWLPFYLLAGCFELFGVSTFTARLPFALLGWGSVALAYALGRVLFRHRRVGLTAASLLTVSLPFLLLTKQCRYYSPTIFLTLLGLWGYARGRYRWVLTPASVLLFYTQNIYFVTLWGTVLGHATLLRKPRLRELWLLSLLAWLTCVPWLWFTRGVSYQAVYPRIFTFSQFVEFIRPYLGQLFAYLFEPWILLVPLAVAVVELLRRRPAIPGGPRLASGVALLVWYVTISLAVLCAVSVAPFFRYLAPVVPVLVLLTAALLDSLAALHPLLLVAAIAGLAWHGGIPDYAYEITHDFRGPVKAITRYLKHYGRPSDTVVVSYEDLPVKFYTGMRVVGGLTGEDLAPARNADWIVLRKHTICSKDEAVKRYVAQHVDRKNYAEITLDAPDSPFENREDPALHRFRPDAAEDRVVILKRIRRE